MRTRNYLGASILALALILAGSAAALAKDTQTVKLPYDMTLKGTPLAAGSYSVSWVGHNSEATVTVANNQDVVATAEARLVEAGKPHTRNAVLSDQNADGTRIIREIRLAGSNKTLMFD